MALRVQYRPWPRITKVWQEQDELSFAAPPASFGLEETYWQQPHRTFMPQAAIWFGDQNEGGSSLGGFRLTEDQWINPGVTTLPTPPYLAHLISFGYDEQWEGVGAITVDEEIWLNPGVTTLPTACVVFNDTDQLSFTFLAGPWKFRKTLSEEGTRIGKRQKHIGEIGDTRGKL